MELGRSRPSEELVPGIRSESCDTREAALDTTEIDRPKNPREIGAERAHGCVALAVRLDTHNQEYRCAGQWGEHWLRNWYLLLLASHIHRNRFDFDLRVFALIVSICAPYCVEGAGEQNLRVAAASEPARFDSSEKRGPSIRKSLSENLLAVALDHHLSWIEP